MSRSRKASEQWPVRCGDAQSKVQQLRAAKNVSQRICYSSRLMVGQPTVDYVNAFVGLRAGMNYRPHLTVGTGTLDVADALEAEPLEALTFRAVPARFYQVGDFGVAQRKLHDLYRC